MSMQTERKRFTVATVTADSGVCDFPRIQPYLSFAGPVDILVVAAGFEERVLAFPRALARDAAAVRKVTLVGHYKTNRSDNGQRYSELLPILTGLSAPVEDFDADEPNDVVAAVGGAISAHGSEDTLSIAFDLSGASSTLILSVIAALIDSKARIRLSILYASAKSYDPLPRARENILNLDSGREIGIGAGPFSAPFGGHHHDHLPATVIAIPSMYTSRLEACLTHLNVGPMTGSADNLFWLLPSTGVEEHKWRQEKTIEVVESLLLKLHGRNDSDGSNVIRADDVATCDVLDYLDTARTLIIQIDNKPGQNVSIVHMGSKMQAIGVALAAAARSEVAVLTARPASFNAATYSSGIGNLYTIEFPDVGVIVSKLRDIGSLVVESI